MNILPRKFTFGTKVPLSSPHFTRRHYIWLASAMRDVLHEVKENSEYPEVETIKAGISLFADALESDNPNFNRQQFLTNIFGNPTHDE